MDEATRSRSRRDDGGGHPPPEAATSESGGGEDLISRLPDCVLGEIVTRLPTADAVRVQLLSTRWRHVWSSSPLNLDLTVDELRPHRCYYHHCYGIVSDLLTAHPGAARRLKLVDFDARLYNRWLRDPALNGLRELEIDPERSGWYPPSISTDPLPARALRFAPTLRVLKIGHLAFPSSSPAAGAAAEQELRFPHLELLSFVRVHVSERALHGTLAGCPVLRTLVLDDCTGFASVRISSPTITSFAVSNVQSRLPELEEDATGRLRLVVIEDAPLLEKLVPFREVVTEESFELRVMNAPRLRVLGSLSRMISKVELGATVFKVASRRVNIVGRQSVVREKRSLMRAVSLATTLPTVRVLALEDVDCIDDVGNFLRCFPCLEKLYVSVSNGFRSVGSYDKENPIHCLEHHLKMVAISGYEDKRSHVKLTKFFLRSARVLQLMKFKSCNSYYGFMTKGLIADHQRHLQIRNTASHHVKFHFVSSYQDVYCGQDIEDLSVHIHDSSRDDPYHQWFESYEEPLEKELLSAKGLLQLINAE
ncbi:unnamed protein product [Urochloa humidicola]